MSTRSCPQCGGPLPDNARFCGQCGNVVQPGGTDASPPVAAVRTPVAPAPDAGTLANARGALPDMSRTMLDGPPKMYEPDVHEEVTVARPMPDLSTLLDAVPSERMEEPATRIVPAAGSPPRSDDLAQTMADPANVQRAREMLDAAIGPGNAQPTGREAMARTMALGQMAAPPPAAGSPAQPGPPAPGQAIETPFVSQVPAELLARQDAASPLSRSVAAPSWPPPAQPEEPRAPLPAAGAPAPGAAAPPDRRARTMLGMPAKDLLAPPPQGPLEAAPPAAAAPARPGAPQKTMLGVAIPGIAPLSSSAPPPPGAHDPQGHASAGGGLQPSPQLHSRVATMLGVSVSGVPGVQQPGAPPQAGSRVRTMLGGVSAAEAGVVPGDLPTIVPAPSPFIAEPLPPTPEMAVKRGVPAIALVLLIAFFVVAAGGVGAFLVFRGGEPLVAAPKLDDSGKESLQIRCSSCPDDTVLSLGASSVKVKGAEALLVLPAPLTIGENKLTVHIDRPGAGRDEDVTLRVPVAYRVRVDLGSLADSPPKITVRVEASAGADVKIDGKPIPLDAAGKGAHAVDVSAETEGESAEVKTLDKKMAFEITTKGGKLESQTLTARTGILPLKVDAPRPGLITSDSTITVAGRTKPGAKVRVSGTPAILDAAGRFTAKAPIEGETKVEVVAFAPPLAPRHATMTVRRVTDLEAAAKEMEAKRPLGFDAFSKVESSKGQLAAVEGEIAEIRVAGGQTIMLVESTRGCATRGGCLVRIVHGAETRLTRGSSVRAYGTVVGSVTAGGRTVPELESPLLIPRAR